MLLTCCTQVQSLLLGSPCQHICWHCKLTKLLRMAQVGTAVVTRQDKRLAVGRLGALVEQIEALVSKDLQVILVGTHG